MLLPEQEISDLSDAQANAIGRLTVGFNMLESVIDLAIPNLIGPPHIEDINVMLENAPFARKVAVLRKLLTLAESRVKNQAFWARLSESQKVNATTWFERFWEFFPLIAQANNFRNNLIHCRMGPAGDGRGHGRLVTSRKVDVESNPEIIRQEARRVIGLAVALFTTCMGVCNLVSQSHKVIHARKQ